MNRGISYTNLFCVTDVKGKLKQLVRHQPIL